MKFRLLAILALCCPLWATTYYVDNCVTVGSDSNNGTSTATPWLTVEKVGTSTFNPGDIVSFRASCTWTNDNLTVPSSGTSGNVITFNSYGTGADPVLDGGLAVTGWTLNSGSIYTATAPQVTQIFQDGFVRLIAATSKAAMVAGSWYWDGTSTLYVWATDSANPSTHTILRSVMTGGVEMNGQAFLLFNNIDVTRWGNHGYDFQQTVGAHDITIQNAVSSWHNGRGVGMGGYTPLNLYNIHVTGLTIHDENGEGVWVGNMVSGGTGCTLNDGTRTNACAIIENNETYNVNKDVSKGYSGIGLGAGINSGINSYNVTVQNNYIHAVYFNSPLYVEFESGKGTAPINTIMRWNYVSEAVAGIAAAGATLEGTGTQFCYNVIADTVSNAVRLDNSGSGQVVCNNTIYAGGSWGLVMAAGLGTGNNFENNIILRSASNGSIFVGSGVTPGTIDYNDYFTSAFWQWSDASNPTTLAAWQTKCSCDAHSISENPNLTSPTTGVFNPVAGSPTINVGANLGATYQSGLNPVSSWPASLSLLPQNQNAGGWDLGAFIFPKHCLACKMSN